MIVPTPMQKDAGADHLMEVLLHARAIQAGYPVNWKGVSR